MNIQKNLRMEQIIEMIVCAEDKGERIDSFLRKNTELSRSRVSELILGGSLSVNGTVQLKPSFKVDAGQTVCLRVPDIQPVGIIPQDIPLDTPFSS